MSLIDLTSLTPILFPITEDDEFEFKSSLLKPDELRKELTYAASAFANSGGGCLIWGIEDATGDADGGIEPRIGRQDVRAWIDKVIHNVDPPPKFDARLYDNNEGRGKLDAGKVIVAISIHPSATGPHMASDKRYYIRAGRHTVPASHFLVEALWARRQVTTPILTPTVRPRLSGKLWAVDLGIVNLTNTPAVSVQVDIEPKLGTLKDRAKYFPVRLPQVDQSNPFYMYLANVRDIDDVLDESVVATINYKDISGNEYTKTNESPLIAGLPPNLRGWGE